MKAGEQSLDGAIAGLLLCVAVSAAIIGGLYLLHRQLGVTPAYTRFPIGKDSQILQVCPNCNQPYWGNKDKSSGE